MGKFRIPQIGKEKCAVSLRMIDEFMSLDFL
jgi:hypothetical protein